MRINIERIQRELKRRKWKLEDMGQACVPPVSRQTIEYTIKHNSLKGLERISKVLDIPITKLIVE
jgi:hypothetical protein